jgi:predicted MFS family arabinose efflux permease
VIGWEFLFFGFYGFLTSFFALTLKIPFGKMIDKYHLRRIFFFAGPASAGISTLLMVFVKDPYILAFILILNSIVDIAHVLTVHALWYDAMPLEVYPLGSAVRGIAYGVTGMTGSLLGAHLWANLGATSSFYIKFIAEISRGLIALYLIRDIIDESKVN